MSWRFIMIARRRDLDVLVRTNLTIMLPDGYTDLPEFYRDQRVRLVASLPCYLPENVDRQRGLRVYEKSIDVIRRLNSVGYGIEPDLTLTLVYNPLGPSLPPEQTRLERDYRRELNRRFGIKFTRLHAITNMYRDRYPRDETGIPVSREFPVACERLLHGIRVLALVRSLRMARSNDRKAVRTVR